MNIRVLGIVLLAIFIFQGCSGSSKLSSNSQGVRTYDKPFWFIEKAVRGSIDGSGVEIGSVSKSTNPKKLTLELVRSSSSEFTATSQQPGSITVLQKSTSETQVKIKNPQYHHTTPQNQRLNYQVAFYPRIEKLIEMNS